MSYKDRLSPTELQRRNQMASLRLAVVYNVTLTSLSPEDCGDECVHCHQMSATVEHRLADDCYCDALCAEAHLDNCAERQDQRNIASHYGA